MGTRDLPARMDRYDPQLLDMLCLAGEVGWARLSVPADGSAEPSTARVARRPSRCFCASTRMPGSACGTATSRQCGRQVFSERRAPGARRARARGASFFNDLRRRSRARCGRRAAGRWRARRRGTCGVRRLLGFACADRRVARIPPVRDRRTHSRAAGRRSRWRMQRSRDADVEMLARTLLRRYGVVFRRVLTREPTRVPWRDLTRVYRRLEARGEIRGGRFVSGMSGEQFALAEAVERLREVRRSAPDGCSARSARPIR